MNKVAVISSVAFAAVLLLGAACTGAAPAPTPTPEPTPTRTPRPTPTPLPPVSINSDCVGCPVVMPHEARSIHQSVMAAYAEWPSASKHPGKVLLVTCYKNQRIRDVGYVMGAPTGRPTERNTVLVSGRFGATSKDRGSCYAITAKYDGRRTVCWETIPSSCAIGLGELVSAMSFLGVGEFTEVSTSQLKMLKEYARASEYQVERQ